jgi:hypothetical protein
MPKKLAAWFDRRAGILAAVLLAIVVALPTLGNGFLMDDYLHRILMFSGGDGNAFEFIHRGTPATEAELEHGVLPWWTHPVTKIVFYRPISQWLMWLDYHWWPDNLLLMHLHSLLWYALTVLVAGFAYRQIMPTRWAGNLASVLFAVDSAHGAAVGWLANRNALLCLSTSLLALLCYRRAGLAWQALGWLLFALSMACGEPALAITGFFFAYEVFLSERPWMLRVLRLLPYALIALGWMVFWKLNGYGTAGPDFYVDPASAPWEFLARMVYRLPGYLVGQLFLPPAEVFGLLEDSKVSQLALVLAWTLVGLLGWLFLPLLRTSRQARFFTVGMVIAAVPICGSSMMARSLWYVGFGATGLLALYLERLRDPQVAPRPARIFGGVMLAVHLCLSPLMFIAYSKVLDVLDALTDAQRVHLPDHGAGRNVLALSVGTYFGAITIPMIKDQALSLGARPTRQAPDITRIRALNQGDGAYDLLRPEADTLVIRRTAGFTKLRRPAYGFAAGDRVDLDDVTVLIPSVTAERAPSVIEYHFKPGMLDTYQVFAWRDERFVDAALPAVGQTLHVTGKD